MDGYLVATPPVPQGDPVKDLKNLTDYAQNEYNKIQAILDQVNNGDLTAFTSAPPRPRAGMVRYAADSNAAATWRPMGIGMPGTLVTFDGTRWATFVTSPTNSLIQLHYNWSFAGAPTRLSTNTAAKLVIYTGGIEMWDAINAAAGSAIVGLPIAFFKSTGINVFAPIVLTSGQIQFPATPVFSANANTIDDFQRGTWTPAITFVTPGDLAITLSPAVGDYYKLGKWVVASFRCNSSAFSFTTASGNLNITGLPYPASNDASFIWPGPLTWGGITKAGYTSMACEVISGTSVGVITASGSGVAPAVIAATDTPTGGTLRLRGTFIYRT